jgi:hypothetical protein
MGDRRVVLFLALVLGLLLLHAPCAYSSEASENEELYEFLCTESPAYLKLFDFLSDVVQLDLTKYGVVPPENVPPGFEGLSPLEFFKQISEYVSTLPTPSKPPFIVDRYGGLATEESVGPDFGYDGTRFGTMAMFVNGHMNYLNLNYYGEEDYVYSEPQPTAIEGRARGILQRYQAYFRDEYGYEALYLVPMLDRLSSNISLHLAEFTEGNLTFHFSQNGDKSLFEWIYTIDGVEIDWKRVSIAFRNNAFESFHDSWGLYNVSGLNTISLEKAVRIVLAAAQNGELRRTRAEPGTGYVNISELVDTRYSVSLMMQPFRFDDYSFPSKISRDPLTIYPQLHIYFYFNNRTRGSMGLDLFVWGDTGEIRTCTDVGKGFYENGPMYDTNTLLQNPEPIEEQEPTSDEQSGEENALDPYTLPVVGGLLAVPAISISVFALKRKTAKLNKAN